MRIPQVFYRRENEHIVLIIGKYVDGILCDGKNDEWSDLARMKVYQYFEWSDWNKAADLLIVNSTEVKHVGRSINVGRNEYVKHIIHLLLSSSRRKQHSDKESAREISQIRFITGSIIHLGMAMYPPTLLVSSVMQQSVPYMIVSRINH